MLFRASSSGVTGRDFLAAQWIDADTFVGVGLWRHGMGRLVVGTGPDGHPIEYWHFPNLAIAIGAYGSYLAGLPVDGWTRHHIDRHEVSNRHHKEHVDWFTHQTHRSE